MPHFAANYIKGKWKEGKGPIFSSVNPATGEPLFEGNSSLPEDIDEAIDAANEMLPMWSLTKLEERIDILTSFQKYLEQSQYMLAETISKETGKPLWESQAEVSGMIHKIPISIEAFQERCKERKKENHEQTFATRFKPHGVIAVLGPFNFPMHLPNGHIIPALLAGNTVIFKPSEFTPLSATRMFEQWEKTTLPKGVVNLVQGGKETGKTLIQKKFVDGVFFTGSYSTGKAIQKEMIDRPGTILALEMGGNNPLVIGKVEDISFCVSLIILSAFATTGQRCTSARRLILPRGKKGEYILEKLKEGIQGLKIGNYQEQPFMGPLINQKALDNLLEKEKELVSKGGISIFPLKKQKENTAFVSPGLIDMTNVYPRIDEEIFGPLLQVYLVSDFDEAIQVANETDYGLSAGLISNDPEEYDLFFEQIRAGIINWNCPLIGASSESSFGGIGKSGNYRPSAYFAADYCSYPVASIESKELTFGSFKEVEIDVSSCP